MFDPRPLDTQKESIFFKLQNSSLKLTLILRQRPFEQNQATYDMLLTSARKKKHSIFSLLFNFRDGISQERFMYTSIKTKKLGAWKLFEYTTIGSFNPLKSKENMIVLQFSNNPKK